MLIPPIRKIKYEVKIKQLTHSMDTKAKIAYAKFLKEQMKESSSIMAIETMKSELEIERRLLKLGPNIKVHIEGDAFYKDCDLKKDCIVALSHKNEYLTIIVILAYLY